MKLTLQSQRKECSGLNKWSTSLSDLFSSKAKRYSNFKNLVIIGLLSFFDFLYSGIKLLIYE